MIYIGGDGWNDDDADWGSLEESFDSNKKEENFEFPAENSAGKFESWSHDLSFGNDKTTIVKQNVQPLKLVCTSVIYIIVLFRLDLILVFTARAPT